MSKLCDEVQKFGKGIGNASRYNIVQALFKGPKTVGELVKIVKMSQPAVSQHLKILKESGIVVDERQGQEIVYSLNSEHVLTLLKNLVTEVSKEKKHHP